ncbi:MAG: nucleotidyltransferase domain-containing protein [Candidatus Cloacimonetes bacterium]|nr:nucleotidyltransferase domain-containing protein [Candidatus Cloacimonadota bacterium]
MKREQIIYLLKEFKKMNKDKFGILSLGIFGSYAKGEAKSDSDLDIVVEISNIDMFLLVHMKDELEKLFNTKIDIVRYRKRMNKYLNPVKLL